MIENFVASFAYLVLWCVAAVVVGLLFKSVDRRLVARMQARVGPPLVQPFRDLRKLMLKQCVVPEDAVAWIFNAAPLVALVASVVIVFYLPVWGFQPLLSGHGDLILVLYLLMVPSIAVLAGGFAAGSLFSSLGAQREMVMLMSYELPLSAVVVAFAWKAAQALPGVPVFSAMTYVTHPIWSLVGPVGAVGLLMLLLVVLLVVPAELSKVPFDAAEAETELAGGLSVEYSGRNLAMLLLSDAAKSVAVASLVVTLFLPQTLSFLLRVPHDPLVEFAFFGLKVFAVLFASVTVVRATAARLRIDQASRLYWAPLSAAALTGLALIIIDAGVL
ncbi:MAG: NADH-quinone oxidoreductase subunit H [Candidatus Diapherotrites archaeon]|nr:NADH-quinone oxidoreductase subunit H [Candidatus Diapherotrites archaeon]